MTAPIEQTPLPMISRLLKLLQPPTFDDPDETRIASVLHQILVILFGLMLFLITTALHPGVAPNPTPVIAIDVAILGLILASLWIVRRGHVQLASIAFSSILWMTVTISTYYFGGISSPTVAIYISVTIMAGFFWGGRGIIGFSAITAIAGLLMMGAEFNGVLPAPLSPINPVNSWITLMIATGLAAMVLSLSRRATDDALSMAQRNALAHRESEERYRGLIEQSPDALFLHSQGVVLFANRTLAEMLEADEGRDLVGCDAVALLQAGGDESDRNRTCEAISATERSGVIQDHWMRANGDRFRVELTTRALQLDGQPAIQVLARDVSERASLEAELRQAQKMEAIGRLAGGIAHDFNNMLTVISGHSRFLLRSLGDDTTEYEDAQEIARATQRAAELTQKLLAFSRHQVLQPVVMDLSAAVRETETMLRRLLGENIELMIDLDDELGCVRADPVQIEQILLNLCVNARDSMDSSGCIEIRTRRYVSTEGDTPPPGEYAELVVRDDGAGMSEEVQSQIFEPFFTTKERFKGTGLGLSTVYGIVNQSGGTIQVTSEPGHGSAFRILLPRANGDPSPARPREAQPAHGNETILVAEDEAGVRLLVERFLSLAGFRVLAAENGAIALQLAERHDDPIDLLITDVIMPEMGGYELSQRLKDSHPEARILYMSGYAGDELGREGRLIGDATFLPKPFTPDVIVEKVRKVLDAPGE